MMHLKPFQRWTQCSSPRPQRLQRLVVRAAEGFSKDPKQPQPISKFPEIYLAQQKQKQQAKAMQLMSKRTFTSFTSEEKWREVDKEINKYPAQRVFAAIGADEESFRKAMVAAVEAVLGPVHEECIVQTPSKGGKYVSVRIGPVWVQNPDQVVQVFNNMREDKRLKWYM